MKRDGWILAGILGGLVARGAALAQPTASGFVITGPVQGAPALAMPVVVMLGVALAAYAIIRLRRPVAATIVGLVAVAMLATLAGLGYAGATSAVVIKGQDCFQVTNNPFNPDAAEPTLTSNCQELIRVIDFGATCDTDVAPHAAFDSFPPCQKGQTLANGATCVLPTCPC